MSADYFRVGEQVRTRSSGAVPEGTIGIIQHAYHSAEDCYEVWFVGDSHGRVVRACDLERVAEAPQAYHQGASMG
jgi:hypothetical protein